MESGIAMPSRRQAGDQVRQEESRRRSSGRSIARPTPINATITVSSVACSMRARLSWGPIGRSSGSGVSPISMPVPISSIGVVTGAPRSTAGSSTARIRQSPATR
jgi:hypothetical protein